jgi:hypothetical protein
MAKIEKKREVNVLSMNEPKALTLTGRPANQVAFRVVRNADGSEVSVPVKRVFRRRASYADGFLCITLPEFAEEEEAAVVAEKFGITDYEVSERDGRIAIIRKDVDQETPSIAVNIGEGMYAYISRGDESDTRVSDKLKLISIEFDSAIFRSEEDVKAFAEKMGIDISEYRTENTDTHVTVTRHDVASDETVGRIQVEDGVAFCVVRSEEQDIPEQYYTVVSETAYGSWGWGQLDFAASLSDVEFSHQAEEATRIMRRVCEDILFYSALPVALRKELLYRAAAQYALYLGNLLDGLPPGVVAVTRSCVESKSKESLMAKKEEQQKEVKREDEEAQAQNQTEDQEAGESAGKGAESSSGESSETLTRSDVSDMIKQAIESLGPDLIAILRKDKEEGQKQETVKPESEKSENQLTESLQAITRSMQEVANAVEGVGKRVQQLENTTVVRSDGVDSRQEKSEVGDPFAGVFTKHMK